jgi:pimeloyl-ACP methyl ester carboxylesterase
MPQAMMNSNGGPSGRRFAVLALHGFPATADDWTPLRDELRDFEWMMPDMPWLAGATVTDKLTFADCLMQIQKMIGEHGDLPVHMIGHDIGGVLAWWIAALLPHMVRSLTVISAPHPKAYLGALNKIVMKRQRDMPAQAAG